MSVMTDGGGRSDGDGDDAFDGDDVVEAVSENSEVVRDYFEELMGSAKADSFVGGFAVGLFLMLPAGQREVAAIFAAMAGVELGDTHGRKKVPIQAVTQGKFGVVGLAVGVALGFVVTSYGLL